MNKSTQFKPDGNDLKRVMFYYGVELEEQIVCPFHDDRRPSCHVNYDEGVFHCFACGVGGDAFEFVRLANPKFNDMRHLRLYFAILNSKKVRQLKINHNKRVESQTQKLAERENDMEMSHDYYFGLKTIDWRNVKSDYKDYMIARGFTSKALNKCRAKLTITDDYYPLIFPIFDLDEFKGYQCRTTNKNIEKRRKYMFSKGFSRIDTIGGEYRNETVVLTEGFLDKVKMEQFGLKHVASLFGWKATTKQIEKLRAAGVKTVISALDMDKPGREGTDYLKNFFEVIEFQFPKGTKDPGDLNQQQFDIAYRKTKAIYRSRRK